MVQELRQLVFSPVEIVEALNAYRARYEEFLPAGQLRLKGIAKNGSLRVEVSMEYGATKQRAVFDITAEDVIRTLICGCEDIGLPIPRNGSKTLAGSASGVSLNIRIDPNRDSGKTDVSLAEFTAAQPLIEAAG